MKKGEQQTKQDKTNKTPQDKNPGSPTPPHLVASTPPQCIMSSLSCSSSGLTTTGPAAFASNRQVELAHREHNINDIAISRGGTILYCAAGSVVQIWDLRRWALALFFSFFSLSLSLSPGNETAFNSSWAA